MDDPTDSEAHKPITSMAGAATATTTQTTTLAITEENRGTEQQHQH